MKCDEFIATYERGLDPRVREKLKAQAGHASAKKPAAKKAATKKAAAKKAPAKKKAAR